MSVIGQQIKKYRMAKKLTQEQLGQLVGVTTQAVSKWERGGTPDAELLPMLSDVLNVSIDALFGREEQSFAASLMQKIGHMADDEAFRYAFHICWAIQNGLIYDPDVPDHFKNTHLDHSLFAKEGTTHYARIMHDGGMAISRISQDCHHFFLMQEPENGLRKQLSDPELLRQVFAVFADQTLMNLIFYLYTRLNTPIATSLISKNTGMTIPEVDRQMEILLKHNLVMRTCVATADGDIYYYMFNQEHAVIPLLCFADELVRKDNDPMIWSFSRSKPIFESTDG